MNLGDGNGPPNVDCRNSSIESAYTGVWNRLNGKSADPHLPFRALLQVPSCVRYRFVMGEQNGWSRGGQNASSVVRRREIFGGVWRLFSEKSTFKLQKLNRQRVATLTIWPQFYSYAKKKTPKFFQNQSIQMK